MLIGEQDALQLVQGSRYMLVHMHRQQLHCDPQIPVPCELQVEFQRAHGMLWLILTRESAAHGVAILGGTVA